MPFSEAYTDPYNSYQIEKAEMEAKKFREFMKEFGKAALHVLRHPWDEATTLFFLPTTAIYLSWRYAVMNLTPFAMRATNFISSYTIQPLDYVLTKLFQKNEPTHPEASEALPSETTSMPNNQLQKKSSTTNVAQELSFIPDSSANLSADGIGVLVSPTPVIERQNTKITAEEMQGNLSPQVKRRF